MQLIAPTGQPCGACVACRTSCPVHALEVRDGEVLVLDERCVGCGTCVKACTRGALAVRDDTPRVRELLASRQPVVALLATEAAAAMHPLTMSQVEHSLELLGFSGIETTLLGEEIVAEAYERQHARCEPLVSIRSTCPVVTDFVRAYYPALVPALAPVVPPYVAQARLIRSLYAPQPAIVYVSPCFARKDEFREHEIADAVDAVIDFIELRALIEGADPSASSPAAMRAAAPRAAVAKEISLTDGFPRATIATRDHTDGSLAVVRGLGELDRLLRAIVAAEIAPSVVDALACDGCLDGPAVEVQLSLFARREVEAASRRHAGVARVSTREMLAVLPAVDVVRSFASRSVTAPPEGPDEQGEPDGRAAFDARLEAELTRHLRYDCPLAVVLIDLEPSERLSEDELLLALASARGRAEAVIRSTDFAAAYGSHLAVMLPGITKTAAFAVAEKLRGALAEAPYQVDGRGYTRDVTMTVSLGVAAASATRCAVRVVMDAAEGALRGAIESGRDRVHLAAG